VLATRLANEHFVRLQYVAREPSVPSCQGRSRENGCERVYRKAPDQPPFSPLHRGGRFLALNECYREIVISIKITGVWLCLAAIHLAHCQSMDCSNLADMETLSKTGPGGIIAVVSVHSEDDHNKDSHQCMANYHLRITLPDGREETPDSSPMGFSNSAAEWGRRLSVHLDGFSSDGQRIFGVISESGKYSFVHVFDFRRGGASVEIPVKLGWSYLRAAKCGTSLAVTGTTNAGEIVLEPNTAERCRTDHHWVLDRAGNLRDATRNDSLMPLYTPRTQ